MRRHFVLLLASALLLSACVGNVKRLDHPVASTQPAAVAQNVRSFNLWLNGNAKALAYKNLDTFDQAKLEAALKSELGGKKLLESDSSQVLDIEITDLNVKNNWSAILFGPFAGADRLSGIVSIKDLAGNVLKKAQVDTTYSFGGLGGGSATVRVAWLYEKFASLAAAQLLPSSTK